MAISKGKRAGTQLGDMHERGSASATKKRREERPHQRWWTLPDEQIPGALVATLRHIQQSQSAFEATRQTCARLYGGLLPGSAYGASGQITSPLQAIHPSLTGRLTYNVISIVVDTLVSKITKDNLSTQFVTTGGNYKQQRRAKKLTQFADGITYETRMDEKGPEIFRDGTVLNEGAIHTYADWNTNRVVSERVIPSEIYVDEVDGLYGTPTQMHRVRLVDREQLLESRWAKDDPAVAEKIKSCRDALAMPFASSNAHASDMITVAESWRLPSGVDEDGQPLDDGHHVIYTGNGILNPPEDRKWKKMRFPFSFYRWKPSLYGWHGVSLAQELIGSQVEMNHLLIMFQRAFRMNAAFRIWVESGTVPDSHFQDKIGTILHGPKGSQPPQFLTPPSMNDQYFRHFDGIKARAFEIARLSQLSAVGQKPAGIDSGEAQRVYHDIEAEGFSYAAKQYENFRLDVVKMQIDVVRDIVAREKKYSLRAPVTSSTLPGQRFLRSIDWKNVALDEDEYILRGYSTSSLPNTPAGRLATIQDMMRAGLIEPDLGRKLLNFPDLAEAQSLMGAAEDWIVSSLDKIVEDGEAQEPDPYMPLDMASKLALQEYALGAANGMEQEKLDLLRSWIQQVDRLKAKAAAGTAAVGAAAAAPAANGAPMGVGAAPEVSPMLPPAGMQGAA